MTHSARPVHSALTRSVLGLMVMAYVVGLLGIAHHLATAAHHDHALAHDLPGLHAVVEESGSCAGFSSAVLQAQEQDSCCQHVHDTPPSVLPLPARDLATKGFSRSLALPCRLVVVPDSSGPDLLRPLAVTLLVCPGAVSITSGRAPPRFLHT